MVRSTYQVTDSSKGFFIVISGNEDVVDATRRFVRSADIMQEKLASRYWLTTSDVLALGYLMDETSLRPGELGRLLRLKPGSMTPIIKRLRASGLIVRQQDAKDMRRATLYLTEEGQRIYQETASVLIDAVDDVNLSDREAIAVLRFLRAMTDRCLSQ